MAIAPVIETLSVDQLRLGYTILQQQQGDWIGEHICYLDESWDADGNHRLRFETANLTGTRNRIFNPEEYQFNALPMSSQDADMPDELTKPSTIDLFKAQLSYHTGRMSEVTYATSHKERLLKHVCADDLADLDIDHRTLRYAAQTLYPGVNVTIRKNGRQQEGRIKAVGFGINCAALGILLHSVEDQKPAGSRLRAASDDFWINAQAAHIAVHDKLGRIDRPLLNIHHLKRMTALDA